jgi:para-aminobenzoate synthetase component 1
MSEASIPHSSKNGWRHFRRPKHFNGSPSLPHVLFLDSAMQHQTLGRYSFIAADPFEFLQLPADGSDGIALLDEKLRPFTAATIADLPPFQGGAAGLLSYDLGRSLERVPLPQFDEFHFPALAIGLYDIVLAYDHVLQRAWLISHGLSRNSAGRAAPASARADHGVPAVARQ